MDLTTFLMAIPKAALFFLLIVGGAIVAEIVYFKRKGNTKIPEVNLPTTPSPNPTAPIPSVVPAVSVMPAMHRSFFSPKGVVAFLVVLFILAGVPAAVLLVGKRQEVRKQAAADCHGITPGTSGCYGEGLRGECSSGGDNFTQLPDPWCDVAGGTPQHCTGVGSKGTTSGYCCNTPGSGYSTSPCNSSPPPGTCDTGGGSCQNDDECCSKICHGAKCCPYENCPNNCASFYEPACHTHQYCHWEAGICKDGPAPVASPGSNVLCTADNSGVKIQNNGTMTVSGIATWYSSWCDHLGNSGCFCGGPTSSENVTLSPGQVWSKSILGAGPPVNCAWQSDLQFAACTTHPNPHGCVGGCATSTPTPTPTPPTYSIRCLDGKRVYDSNWTQITNLSSLRVGQTVRFTVSGEITSPKVLTKARFRINSGAWQETTNKHGNDFYMEFTIPIIRAYKVEAMVFNPDLGWW